MLSIATIDNYIETIPPIPEIVKKCVNALNSENLILAADIANGDRALIHYLKSIVNKPIFGFVDEVKDARQIFGILGLVRAKQLMYGYYILLILPKEWKVFDFNTSKFQDLQAKFIFGWGKIMKALQKENEDLVQAISIIPASLVVCEMLFRDINDTVVLLRERKQISYNAILCKMTERTFFDIAALIAKKWEFTDNTIELIQKIGNDQEGEFGENALEIQYLRLLIMYEMSRPYIVDSGLNDLFDFEAIFSDEVTNSFYKIIEDDK